MRRKKKKGEEDIPEHGGEEKELRREEKKKKWILMFFTCGGKEEEEEEERRRVCCEIRDSRNFPSVIPIVIDMMNSVHSLPTVLSTEFTDTSTFFLLCFNYFVSHYNSLGIYRGNIAVGIFPRKVFPRYFRLYLLIF